MFNVQFRSRVPVHYAETVSLRFVIVEIFRKSLFFILTSAFNLDAWWIHLSSHSRLTGNILVRTPAITLSSSPHLPMKGVPFQTSPPRWLQLLSRSTALVQGRQRFNKNRSHPFQTVKFIHTPLRSNLILWIINWRRCWTCSNLNVKSRAWKLPGRITPTEYRLDTIYHRSVYFRPGTGNEYTRGGRLCTFWVP